LRPYLAFSFDDYYFFGEIERVSLSFFYISFLKKVFINFMELTIIFNVFFKSHGCDCKIS